MKLNRTSLALGFGLWLGACWSDLVAADLHESFEHEVIAEGLDAREFRRRIRPLLSWPSEHRDVEWLYPFTDPAKGLEAPQRGNLYFVLGQWIQPSHRPLVMERWSRSRDFLDLGLLAHLPGPESFKTLISVFKDLSKSEREEQGSLVMQWCVAVLTPECREVLGTLLVEPSVLPDLFLNDLCNAFARMKDPLHEPAQRTTVQWKGWMDREGWKREGLVLSASEHELLNRLKTEDRPQQPTKVAPAVRAEASPLPQVLSRDNMISEAIGWGFPEAEVQEHLELLQDLFSTRAKVRARTLLVLREEASPEWEKLYVHFLEDDSVQVREAALDNLTILVADNKKLKKEMKQHKETVEKVRVCLQDRSSRVKISAIQLLTLINDRESYPKILKLAKDPNEGVLRSVMDAVAKKTMREALPQIKGWLNDERWEVRARAARIFVEIDVERKEELDALLEASRWERDPFVQSELALALDNVDDDLEENMNEAIESIPMEDRTPSMLTRSLEAMEDPEQLKNMEPTIEHRFNDKLTIAFLNKAGKLKVRPGDDLVNRIAQTRRMALLRPLFLNWSSLQLARPDLLKAWINDGAISSSPPFLLLVALEGIFDDTLRRDHLAKTLVHFSDQRWSEFLGLIRWRSQLEGWGENDLSPFVSVVEEIMADSLNPWPQAEVLATVGALKPKEFKTLLGQKGSQLQKDQIRAWMELFTERESWDSLGEVLQAMVKEKLPVVVDVQLEDALAMPVVSVPLLELLKRVKGEQKEELFSQVYRNLPLPQVEDALKAFLKDGTKVDLPYDFLEQLNEGYKPGTLPDLAGVYSLYEQVAIDPWVEPYLFQRLHDQLSEKDKVFAKKSFTTNTAKAPSWAKIMAAPLLGEKDEDALVALLTQTNPQDLDSYSFQPQAMGKGMLKKANEWARTGEHPGTLAFLSKNYFGLEESVREEMLRKVESLQGDERMQYVATMYLNWPGDEGVLKVALRLLQDPMWKMEMARVGLYSGWLFDQRFKKIQSSPSFEKFVALKAGLVTMLEEWEQDGYLNPLIPHLKLPQLESLLEQLSDEGLKSNVKNRIRTLKGEPPQNAGEWFDAVQQSFKEAIQPE